MENAFHTKPKLTKAPLDEMRTQFKNNNIEIPEELRKDSISRKREEPEKTLKEQIKELKETLKKLMDKLQM